MDVEGTKLNLEDNRGTITKILTKLPWMEEYVNKREYYEIDRKIRDEIANNIHSLNPIIDRIVIEVEKKMWIDTLDHISLLQNRIEELYNKIKYADYGYIFQGKRLKSEDIEKLVIYDNSLIEKSEKILKEAENIDKEDKNKFIDGINKIIEALKELSKSFEERENVFKEVL